MTEIDDIKYCPVCGSQNIDKVILKSGELSIAVDYWCDDCESNGDLVISKTISGVD